MSSDGYCMLCGCWASADQAPSLGYTEAWAYSNCATPDIFVYQEVVLTPGGNGCIQISPESKGEGGPHPGLIGYIAEPFINLARYDAAIGFWIRFGEFPHAGRLQLFGFCDSTFTSVLGCAAFVDRNGKLMLQDMARYWASATSATVSTTATTLVDIADPFNSGDVGREISCNGRWFTVTSVVDNDTLVGAGWSGDSGTSTAIGATTLTDASKLWGVGAYDLATVTQDAGGGDVHTILITSNTATVLTAASDSGICEAKTGTTLTDTDKAWQVNSWVGATAIITDWDGDHILTVTSNTPTVLTGTWAPHAPDSWVYTLAFRWSPHQPHGAAVAYTVTGGAPNPSASGYQLEDFSCTMATALSLDTWYWVSLQTRDANLGSCQSALRLYNSTGTLLEEISRTANAGLPAYLSAAWLGMFYITSENGEYFVGGHYATTGGRWPPPAPWFLGPSVPTGIATVSGTSTAIGATTLTDAARSGQISFWIGAVITQDAGGGDVHTLVVTASSAVGLLTGSAGWAPHQPHAAAVAYVIDGPQMWDLTPGTGENAWQDIDDVNPTDEANYIGTSVTAENAEFSMGALGFNATATADSVTATTMTDTGAFVVNRWRGATLAMGGSTAVVTSNTVNVLSFAAWVGGTPAAGVYTLADNVLAVGARAFHYEGTTGVATRCRLAYDGKLAGINNATPAATTWMWNAVAAWYRPPGKTYSDAQWTPTTADATNVRVVSTGANVHRVSSIVKWAAVGPDWADDIPRSTAADLII